MSAIGNFLWFILGGLFLGLSWWFAGFVAYATVVGIPWGRACFVMGNLAFLPFGKEVISRDDLLSTKDIGTGLWGSVGNIVWFIVLGMWLAIGHVVAALFSFVTIIGIPFGLQHLKLAGIALAPIGKTVVTKEVAAAAKKMNAEGTVAQLRGGGTDDANTTVPLDKPVHGDNSNRVLKKVAIAGAILLVASFGFNFVKHFVKKDTQRSETAAITTPHPSSSPPPALEPTQTLIISGPNQPTTEAALPDLTSKAPRKLTKADQSKASAPVDRSKPKQSDDASFTTLDKANTEIDRAMANTRR